MSRDPLKLKPERAPMEEPDRITAVIPAEVLEICSRLRDRGKRVWIVGGCIRDILRGQTPSDWDLATDARPKEVQKTFQRVIPTGIQHGTVTVLMGNTPYEVTTLRGEGAYQDGRRPDRVEFLEDITEDLARRDFTFNAIALDPLTRELIDPFGGRQDLLARQIRAVGTAAARFAEDGLRVMRAARFSATLECTIEAGTLAAMGSQTALDTFGQVSAERIHDEWLKALSAVKPSVAFSVMAETGMLAVCCPELAALIDDKQASHQLSDPWHHSLATLDACPHDPCVRLAGLFHRLGEAHTSAAAINGGGDESARQANGGANIADAVMKRLKFSKEHRTRVTQLVRHHAIAYTPDWTDTDVRRWMQRVAESPTADVFALARAVTKSREEEPRAALARLSELEDRVNAQLNAGVALTTRALAVDGKTLMKHLDLPPGPTVGALLRALLERVTEEPALNERQRLLEEAQRIATASDSG